MAQTAIATFAKAGSFVRVSEVEIFGDKGFMVVERRYVVFVKKAGGKLNNFLYQGKEKALSEFAYVKSLIEGDEATFDRFVEFVFQ